MRHVPHHSHPANVYAAGPLDRADKLRMDPGALAAARAAPGTRLVPVWRSLSLIRMDPAAPAGWTPARAECDWPEAEAEDLVFLGLDADQTAYFAVDLSDRPEPPVLAPETVFEDLRRIGPLLGDADAAVLAYARGLVHWHRRHRFCGVCGAATEARKGGHMRRCAEEACDALHFPRTDPAVIMLVHDGGDRIVLGRQREWPPGRSSVLAGFVEPGESLEDAVAREVMEEVGLHTADIRYHSSQPWPFPSSIMLGFTARATSDRLTVDTDELAEARWVSRDEVLNSPEDAQFALPRRDSIAYRLIRDWAEGR
jgi:NAD+ diphosphatase